MQGAQRRVTGTAAASSKLIPSGTGTMRESVLTAAYSAQTPPLGCIMLT